MTFQKKMKDLIECCWSNNVNERPSFEDIFKTLSEDFNCSPEEVDQDEVNDYIESIKESNESSSNSKFVDGYIKIVKDQFNNNSDDTNKLLFDACKSGNIQLVEYILANKSIDINSKIVCDKKKIYDIQK